MILELIFTLELFIADLAVELANDFLLLSIFMEVSTFCLLFFEVLFNLFESFFLHLLFDFFHFLFLLFLSLFSLQFFLYPFFLFFLHLHLILPESGVSFLDIGYQVSDCLDIGLFLPLSLFLVLFLHLSSHPTIVSLSSVPFLTPYKSFISCKIFPIFIKLQHFFFWSVRHTKAFIFSELLLQVLSRVVSFGFFCFDFFKYISIDSIEPFSIILKAFEAVHGEVGPNVETKTILFEIFLAHLVFVEEHLLSVVVVPGSFVGI